MDNNAKKTGLLELQTILKMAEDQTYKAGEYIFKEGQESSYFYIVLKGNIQILKSTEDGKERSIAYLKSGDILGEGVLAGRTLKPASARAKDDVSLLAISRESFQEISNNEPKAAIDFLISVLGTVNERLMLADDELITIYEVDQLLNQYRDDLKTLCSSIIEKLIELTGSNAGAVFLKTSVEESYRTIATVGGISHESFAKQELQSSTFFCKEEGCYMLEKLDETGFLALFKSKENGVYSSEDKRITKLIADQVSAGVEGAFQRASAKAKNLLHQKKFTL